MDEAQWKRRVAERRAEMLAAVGLREQDVHAGNTQWTLLINPSTVVGSSSVSYLKAMHMNRVPIIMSFETPSGRPGRHLVEGPVDFRPAYEAVRAAAAQQEHPTPLAIYFEIPWVEAIDEDGSAGRARPALFRIGPDKAGA